MSLDQSINHGKDHRKQYYGSKAIDPSCRNHGSCEWCRRNRTYSNYRREEAAKCRLKDRYYEDY